MVLIILPLIFLWRVVFQGHILLSLDLLLSYEPWRSEIPGAIAFRLWNERMADAVRSFFPIAKFIHESWQHGEIPYWYPYAGNGLPLLGAGTYQVFYPINLIFEMLMPVHVAFGWSAVFHLIVGSLLAYLFMRELGVGQFGRLVGALAFVYNSSTMIWLGIPNVVDTAVWLPLMFFGYERAINRKDWRWTLLGALAGVLQISAGMIQLVMYGLTGFGFYVLFRSLSEWWEKRDVRDVGRHWAYGAIIAILTCGLSAYQLIPLAELVSETTRSDVIFDVYTPKISLIQLLVPEFLGRHMDGPVQDGFRIEARFYIGLLTLFLLIASLFSIHRRKVWNFFGVGLLFVFVIYNIPPFFQIFYKFFPTFPSLGFLRSIYVITFVWAVAAGFGADWLLTVRPTRVLRRLVWLGLGVGVIFLAIALRLAFIAKYQERHFWGIPPIPDINPNPFYFASTLLIFLVFLGVILTLLWLWAIEKIPGRAFAGLSTLILIIDLFLTHIDTAPALPESMFYPVTPSLNFLQQQLANETEPYRISSTGRVLWPSTGGAFAIHSVSAHTGFPLTRYEAYANATGVRANTNFRVVTYQPSPNRLLDALNVKYIYTTRSELADYQGWVSLIRDIGNPNVTSEHGNAGQVEFWNIKNWTQPVIQAPSPSVISFEGPLPEIVTLEMGIVIHPDSWNSAGALFEIYIGTPAEPLQNLVFSQTLSPRDNADHQGWVPVTLTVNGNPRQTMVVSFVTQSQGEEPVLAGWADPLIRPGDDFELLYYGPNNIYFNKNYLPRAWVVHQATQVPLDDIDSVVDRLESPDFDPAVEAVIEGKLPDSLGYATPNDVVNIQTYKVSEVILNTNLVEPGLIILSDIYYPGWKAYVDGSEQPIYPANLAMRGVFVESGQHTVRFVYTPMSLKIGGGISLACLLIVLIGLAVNVAYRRKVRTE